MGVIGRFKKKSAKKHFVTKITKIKPFTWKPMPSNRSSNLGKHKQTNAWHNGWMPFSCYVRLMFPKPYGGQVCWLIYQKQAVSNWFDSVGTIVRRSSSELEQENRQQQIKIMLEGDEKQENDQVQAGASRAGASWRRNTCITVQLGEFVVGLCNL